MLHPAGGGAALFFQRGKGVEVPEEAGYPDQELLEQDIDFLGILPEVTEIRVDIVNLVDCHASLNSASNRLRLVLGEVMTCFVADQEKNVLQAFVGGRGAERCITSIYLLDITQELSGDLLGRQDVIDQTRGDGTLRHPVVFGADGVLDDNQPSFALDRFYTDNPFAPCPGKNDADGIVALVLGEAAEKVIDGVVFCPFLMGFQNIQGSLDYLDHHVRRDNVDAVGGDPVSAPGLAHRHGGMFLRKLSHNALAGRIQMRDLDKGHPAVSGYVIKKILERLESARRRADTDNIGRPGRRFGMSLIPVRCGGFSGGPDVFFL